MSKLLATVFLILSATSLFARPASDSSGISVGVVTGFSWFPAYDFQPTSGVRTLNFKPGITLGFSASVASLTVVEPTSIDFILDVRYARSGTGHIWPIEMTATQRSIMAWSHLEARATVAPFVELGIGYGSFTYEEISDDPFLESVAVTNSGLSLGASGGISVAAFNSLMIQSFIQTIYVLGDMNVAANNHTKSFAGAQSINYAGLRVLYRL